MQMQNTIKPTPKEFELLVKKYLEISGCHLNEFQAAHREMLPGFEGVYQIDITARFKALGADFLVLIECKNQTSPIKREVVQVLRDRIRSTGAHKGMLFATTRFQKGAIQYATRHGIALISIPKLSPFEIITFRYGPIPVMERTEAKRVLWIAPYFEEEKRSDKSDDLIELLKLFLTSNVQPRPEK